MTENIRPGPPQPGEPPTYVWTWVDSHGYTNLEVRKPAPHIQKPTAYITVAEHNRLLAAARAPAPVKRGRR